MQGSRGEELMSGATRKVTGRDMGSRDKRNDACCIATPVIVSTSTKCHGGIHIVQSCLAERPRAMRDV